MCRSDLVASQPTQLLQHALASPSHEHSDPASPSSGHCIAPNELSLESRVIPIEPATPCYHLPVSLPQSPECALADDSQKEKSQEARISNKTSPPSSVFNGPVRGSCSEFFNHHGDNPLTASAAKVIATKSGSFRSPPSVPPTHSLPRPTSSMPATNWQFRRSPSFASQDSFGGPVLQDPAEQYLASTKQFDVPLSELGETPTQEVIHPPADPALTLPDASEHREFLDAAMREYDAQLANRTASSRRTNILVHATQSSDASQNRDDPSLYHNRSPEFVGQESRFEFGGSSSFDKMLDRDLTDPPDPTPEPSPPGMIESARHVELRTEAVRTTSQSNEQRSPAFDWIAPVPSADVASSNPRSLLRMVHPGNEYRIAKMRNLAGAVEPPSYVTVGAATQPSHMEETQPCHTNDPADPNASSPPAPVSPRIKMASSRPTRYQPKENKNDELEDILDVVPDSEPLRAEPCTQMTSHHPTTQSPLKNHFRLLDPISEHESEDIVPDSLEVEESEADVPLAAELFSRNTKKRSTDRQSRKVGTTSSEKVEKHVLEEQTRKPTSSTREKKSKIKYSKTELAEVPTSLPEQDLQSPAFSSKQLPAAATYNPPSKRKGRGPQPVESSLAQHNATKSAVGTKRRHKSDTESSDDDLVCQEDASTHPRAQKEEEEESDSADARDDLPPPPPPPPKLDTTRKRRRTEDVNANGGVSKGSTSTRIKRSETPGIVTRSSKKLRSSTRGFSAEPATRVFALWRQDGHYYSGVVHSLGTNNKNKFSIKFDDNTEDEVELKNMRRRELSAGDRVIAIADGARGVVSDISRAHSHGSFILEIDDGEAVTAREVEFGDIRIANRTIQSQWKDRALVAENILTVVKPKAPVDNTPSRLSVFSTNSGKAQRELHKTGFVVTISPKHEQPEEMKDEVMHAIKEHGGLVIDDWSSVFTMKGKHSQSDRRWVVTPQDFLFKPDAKLDRVFLLSDDAHQKPKFLIALALGIPCISFEWLTKHEKISSDWQPHLLPAGYADPLGARISQLVDLDWGNCMEHIADIMSSRVPMKLFSQKKVLCIGEDLVPHPPKKDMPEEASRYVPWIILCMGAAKVEAITDKAQVNTKHMNSFDYIIVKEGIDLGNIKLEENVVVKDVPWVKECLVSSRLTVES